MFFWRYARAYWLAMDCSFDRTGFDPDHHPARRNGKGGFGLLGMRERAAGVGGIHQVKSSPRAGTEIVVRIPLTRNVRRTNRQTDL